MLSCRSNGGLDWGHDARLSLLSFTLSLNNEHAESQMSVAIYRYCVRTSVCTCACVCACVRECVQFNHICYGLCVHSLVCTSVRVSQWPVRTLLHTRGRVSMLPSVTTSKGWEPRCCLFSFLSFFCSFFLLSDSVSKITDREHSYGPV